MLGKPCPIAGCCHLANDCRANGRLLWKRRDDRFNRLAFTRNANDTLGRNRRRKPVPEKNSNCMSDEPETGIGFLVGSGFRRRFLVRLSVA